MVTARFEMGARLETLSGRPRAGLRALLNIMGRSDCEQNSCTIPTSITIELSGCQALDRESGAGLRIAFVTPGRYEASPIAAQDYNKTVVRGQTVLISIHSLMTIPLDMVQMYGLLSLRKAGKLKFISV